MKKEIKVKSHAERMAELVKYDCYHKPSKHMVYKDVEVKEGNKVFRDTRLTEYDPVENFAQYTADMFDLDNLIAIGAVENLKGCTVAHSDIDRVLDQLDNIQ